MCGFHIHAAYRIAKVNKPKRMPGSAGWWYPSSKDVLEEVGLYTIDHYIGVRRESISSFIRVRPIFQLCMDGQRKRGSSSHALWWEQQLSEDLESDEDSLSGVSSED